MVFSFSKCDNVLFHVCNQSTTSYGTSLTLILKHCIHYKLLKLPPANFRNLDYWYYIFAFIFVVFIYTTTPILYISNKWTTMYL